jgi:WD40 repeat protein
MGDGAVILCDLATGRPRRRLDVPSGPLIGLAYSPNGRWLASTSPLERPVRLWDLEGRQGDRLIGSSSNSRDALAFSPDGRLLATAGADRGAQLWDLATGEELRRVGEPGDCLTGVAFSPDGRMLAATGTDADIRLWLLADLLGAERQRGSGVTD